MSTLEWSGRLMLPPDPRHATFGIRCSFVIARVCSAQKFKTLTKCDGRSYYEVRWIILLLALCAHSGKLLSYMHPS